MTSSYHLLHFLPDLTTGTRFTVGAVVQVGESWAWVEAPLLPPSAYLGSKKQALLELALARLRRSPQAGLPQVAFPAEIDPRNPPTPRLSHLGNHFRASPPFDLPEQEADPETWVRQSSLPRPPEEQAPSL